MDVKKRALSKIHHYRVWLREVDEPIVTARVAGIIGSKCARFVFAAIPQTTETQQVERIIGTARFDIPYRNSRHAGPMLHPGDELFGFLVAQIFVDTGVVVRVVEVPAGNPHFTHLEYHDFAYDHQLDIIALGSLLFENPFPTFEEYVAAEK